MRPRSHCTSLHSSGADAGTLAVTQKEEGTLYRSPPQRMRVPASANDIRSFSDLPVMAAMRMRAGRAMRMAVVVLVDVALIIAPRRMIARLTEPIAGAPNLMCRAPVIRAIVRIIAAVFIAIGVRIMCRMPIVMFPAKRHCWHWRN